MTTENILLILNIATESVLLLAMLMLVLYIKKRHVSEQDENNHDEVYLEPGCDINGFAIETEIGYLGSNEMIE